MDNNAVLTGAVGIASALVTAVGLPVVQRWWKRGEEHAEGTIKFQEQLLRRVVDLETKLEAIQQELAERTERYQRLYTEHEILKRENHDLQKRIVVLEAEAATHRGVFNL